MKYQHRTIASVRRNASTPPTRTRRPCYGRGSVTFSFMSGRVSPRPSWPHLFLRSRARHIHARIDLDDIESRPGRVIVGGAVVQEQGVVAGGAAGDGVVA